MARPDRDTFDQLVREHHAAVYRSALRVLRNGGEAEDVAQDVFVRALAGKVPLDAPAGPRPALCWLATRLSLNALRGARRRQRNESGAAMPNEPIPPAEHAAGAELHASVRRLVDDLPDELRLPLLLRYQDELTFAGVGTALSLSESTAHERVQQALAKLRRQLGPAGVALADARLPSLFAEAAPAAAPPGLQARLLALHGAGAAAAVPAAAKVALLAVLGAAAVTATVMLATAGGTEPPREVANAPRAEAASREAAAGQEPVRREAADAPAAGAEAGPPLIQRDAAVATHASFTGTVRDALLWPVPGARVVAVTAGGLKPFEIAATTTDGAGAFALQVPFAGEPIPASKIRIRVLEQSQMLLETDELELQRDREPEPLHLRLQETAGTETARFTLSVTVRGPGGEPLAGVPVTLFADRGPPSDPDDLILPEVQAETGGDGIALLAGRRPGKKRVSADGRSLGLRVAFATVPIDRPGLHEAVLDLAPGGTLAGHVATVDGSELEWISAWLEEETTRLQHPAKPEPGGAIRFSGLGDGPFTLRVHSHGYSPAALRGLLPGPTAFEVRLKRQHDARDVGHHLAELHGRLIDADSGQPVRFRGEHVDVLPARAGESTLGFDRIEPPRPVQTMFDDRELETFHLCGLAAGAWAVIARVPGYAGSVAIFELREGELRAGIDVLLQRPARVTGRVLGADGRAMRQVFVFVAGFGTQAEANIDSRDHASGPRHGASPSVLACSARTREDGSFVLQGVPPDAQLRVVSIAAGHARAESAPLVLRPGEVKEGVELRLAPR